MWRQPHHVVCTASTAGTQVLPWSITGLSNSDQGKKGEEDLQHVFFNTNTSLSPLWHRKMWWRSHWSTPKNLPRISSTNKWPNRGYGSNGRRFWNGDRNYHGHWSHTNFCSIYNGAEGHTISKDADSLSKGENSITPVPELVVEYPQATKKNAPESSE